MSLVLGSGNDVLNAGSGDDEIYAGAGNDKISAGAGNDLVDGGTGNDNLDGGAGSDTLLGGAGSDTLDGNTGNDTVDGGAGSDTVRGGAGDDLAIYTLAENSIGDVDRYQGGSGNDTVLLRFTLAEWERADVQADIANYLAFLSQHAAQGEIGQKFQFTAFNLEVQQFEILRISVDGTEINPTGNDGPFLKVADSSGAVTEDASTPNLTDTGTITFDDFDLSDSHVTSVTPNAGNTLGGSLTAVVSDQATGAGDGTVTWTYTVANSATQYLAAGQTATESFTVTINDQHGGTVDQIVTVTVTGTNDTPTISVADGTGAVTEDASTPNLTDTGTITFDDVDLTDSHITSVAADAGNTLGGTLTASVTDTATGAGDGTVTWTYTVANSATQSLAAGQTATESFTVTINDQHGGTVDQVVTVTVTGTNDAPTISVADGTGAVTEDASTPNLTDTGTITFDDVDLTDSHITSVAADAGNTLGGTLTASVTDTATGAGDGTVTWTYTVANSATQYLAAGQTATESFTVTINDQHGGTVDQVVTVTVTGTNDAPTISVADGTGAVTEDTSTPNLTDTGTITFDDVDLTDSHITSVTSAVGNTLGGTLTASVTDTATGAGDGTVTWTYTVANSATQYLAAGQTVTESFTVTINDQHGGTVDQVVTVTVTGTNDAPTISVADGTGAVTEDASTPNLTDTGTITFDDVDLADSHITSVTPDAGNTLGGTLTAVVSDVATGAGDGTVTWTYTVANAATQYLADGETVTEKFTITIDDQHGGTVDQLVTVTVTGTNDKPTISVADSTGAVTEDASTPNLSDTGTINFDDVDLTDSHITSVAADAGNTLGGTLTASVTDTATGVGDGTVTWTYTVANSATQYLAAGQTVTESFTVTINDQHGGTVDQVVTVTVTGTNDAPTISVADGTGAVTEDASTPNLTDTGTITFDDVDLTDSHITSVAADAGNTLGGTLTASVTDTATGAGDGTVTWTYTVANSATQYLAAGQTVTESFTVTINDQHGGTVDQVVTVTVTGTNDAPTISVADGTGAVTEDTSTPNLTDTGTITFDDVDLTDSHITSVTSAVGNTLGGTLTASVTDTATGVGDGTVTWTYTVANSATQFLTAGQTATESFTVTINDQHGGTVDQVVTVTVTGTNDAPVISVVTTDSAAVGLTETNAGLSASGTLTVNDTDTADTVSSTVSSVIATGTTAGLGVSNTQLLAMMSVAPLSGLAANSGDLHNLTWTFDSGSEAFNYLGAGETLTLTYTVQSTDNSLSPLSDTQTVTVTITGTADGPAAIGDNVITNAALGNNIVIPEWALLANDTGGAIDVASAGSAIGGSVTHTPGVANAGTVTFIDTAPAGGSFTYTATDGTSPGTPGTVTVTQDAVGTLDGTAGNDILVSANSASILVGGAGDDILLGGGGNDTYRFGLSDGADVVSDTGGGGDAIQISTNLPTDSTQIGVLNFERVGSDLVIDVGATEITVKDHYVSGNSVESISFTNGGTVYGYALSTTGYSLSTDAVTPLNGTGNEDVIASSSGTETLSGGNGNDLLFGNGGIDTITGGAGNDLIVGGLGSDNLTGGNGSDAFVFNTALNAATNVDAITDFNASATDKIMLDHLIFSNIGTGGTLAASDFAAISDGVAGTAGASVNILYDTTSNLLYFDSDGANTASGRTVFANLSGITGTLDNNDFFVF